MEITCSILALVGMGCALYKGWKWMTRAGQAHTRHDQPLTPNDLKVLEESAARLIADLRATADECVASIDRACADAERRIHALEVARYATDAWDCRESHPTQPGLTTGEIELLRGLESIRPGG